MNPPNVPAMDDDEDGLLGRLGAALGPISPPLERQQALRERALAVVRQPVTIAAAEGGWEALLPGIRRKTLLRDAAGHSFLLAFDAGAVLPSHPHRGDEECVVVSGEVEIGAVRLRAGDYRLERAGSTHVEVRAATPSVVFIRYHGARSG